MAMTKSQIQAELAQRTGLDKKQVKHFLDEQAKLAYQEAQNGYAVQGIGIPAKTAVKFRVTKVCKDSVL